MAKLVLARPVDPALVAWMAMSDEGALVVFAASRGQARRKGADALCDDFVHTSVYRRRKWDVYAQLGHVPVAELIVDGWLVPCSSCGREDVGAGFDVGELDRVTCSDCVGART